jgi:hypothetical protein
MKMDIVSMFADSVQFRDLKESITDDMELQEVLLQTQGTINGYIAAVGEILVSEIVADTYMMFGDVFSTETVKNFSIAAVMFNRKTDEQSTYVFSFRFYLVGTDTMPAGLYQYVES